MSEITEDVLVDARELMCPMPVMAATKAVRRMDPARSSRSSPRTRAP